ncbi:hypothetical protein [Arthrobacter humicola]
MHDQEAGQNHGGQRERQDDGEGAKVAGVAASNRAQAGNHGQARKDATGLVLRRGRAPSPANSSPLHQAPHRAGVVRLSRTTDPPRKEQTVRRTASNGQSYEKRIAASDCDYPLAPEAFLVGPSVVVGIVSPHAGAISGEAATRDRAVPPASGADALHAIDDMPRQRGCNHGV